MKAVLAAAALVTLATACPGQPVDPEAGVIQRYNGRVAEAADCTVPDGETFTVAGRPLVVILDHGPLDLFWLTSNADGTASSGPIFKGVGLSDGKVTGTAPGTDGTSFTITATLGPTIRGAFSFVEANSTLSCPFTADLQ